MTGRIMFCPRWSLTVPFVPAEKTAKMEHMKSHSGDKVYPCTVCGTLFTNKAKLEDHMNEHKVENKGPVFHIQPSEILILIGA